MNQFKRKLKNILASVERKRLNIFNSGSFEGMKFELKEALIDSYCMASIFDGKQTLFTSHLYEKKTDVLFWVEKKLQQLMEESEFMEGIGYVQNRFSGYSREISSNYSIKVERNSYDGYDHVEVKLVSMSDPAGSIDGIIDFLHMIGDIKSPVLKMEKRHMNSSFLSMNGKLRDMLLVMED